VLFDVVRIASYTGFWPQYDILQILKIKYMEKNAKRKLSLKKVTVAQLESTAQGLLFTDGDMLWATAPTKPPVTVYSTVPTCRFHTLK
jgi:hypothetical protein